MLASCNDEFIRINAHNEALDAARLNDKTSNPAVEYDTDLLDTPLFSQTDGSVIALRRPKLDTEIDVVDQNASQTANHPEAVLPPEPLPDSTTDVSILGQDVAMLRESIAKQGGNCFFETVSIVGLLPDPIDRPDNEGEWIILYNANATDIVLRGWHITDNKQDSLIFEQVGIRADQFLLIGRSNIVRIDGDDYVSDVISNDFRLSNAGESIVLLNEAGETISSITYATVEPGIEIYFPCSPL